MKTKLVVGIIIVVILIAVGLGAYWFIQNQKQAKEVEKVHIHAAFNVYVEDQLQDYSGSKFMKVEPCSKNPVDTSNDPVAEQLEKAHLHDHTGDVVHVHRPESVWGDLFTNIDVKFPAELEVTAYINDEKIEGDILARAIGSYDRVLILIGANTDIESKLAAVPSIDHIKEVESHSETCGD